MDCLELLLSALKTRRGKHLWRHEVDVSKSTDTSCPRGAYHVCVVKPLIRVRERRVCGVDEASAETKHLLKHWTFLCNFTYFIQIVNVDVAIVLFKKKKKKGRAPHPVKTLCVLPMPAVLLAQVQIIIFLQYKLFLMIFKCIYVPFFYFAKSEYICIAVNKKVFLFWNPELFSFLFHFWKC